jgi:uncharacterized membrane protein
MTPALFVHISGAVIGLLSGYLAMFLRKGSGLHGAAGTAFGVAMMTMSSTAVYVARFERPNMLNVTVGLLTFYLVTTAWRTARRRNAEWDRLDLVALLYVLGVAAIGLASGFEAALSATGTKDKMPAGIYFFFGSCALLCAVLDVRMYKRGGVSGPRRIARHLLRMSFALFIATFSLYPGQARIFPKEIRDTNLLFIPHLVLAATMIIYTLRMRRQRMASAQQVVAANVAVATQRAA